MGSILSSNDLFSVVSEPLMSSPLVGGGSVARATPECD